MFPVSTFLITKANQKSEFHFRSYSERYDDVNFDRTLINSDIAGNGDINSILHLLKVANDNVIKANYLAFISFGKGNAKASLLDINGSLKYSDVYIRNNDAFYMQSFSKIISVSSKAPFEVLNLTEALLNQAERIYSPNGKEFIIEKTRGNKAKIEPVKSYPFYKAEFVKSEIKRCNLKQFNEEQYVRSNNKELTNFVITKETIQRDTINMKYSNGLYTFSFNINLQDKTSRDAATRYSRARLRNVSGSKDLEYKIYKITIELWDNGLIRKITKEESWEATLNIGPLSPSGTTKSSNTSYYSFNPLDCNFTTMNIDLNWTSNK